MAQNIYDDDTFFEGYSQFPRSRQGLAAAYEWPSLRAMLPDVTGLRILDLGCGFGFFARWAVENGAAAVTGIDLSENMLAEARRKSEGLPITYRQADLETLDLGGETYDLVFSSLAVHYVADFPALLAVIRAVLADGGQFVFSTEHPIYAARAHPEWAGDRIYQMRDYLVEGPKTTNWIVEGVVKHHRVISTIIRNLHQAGFTLADIEEWGPSDDLIAEKPDFIEHRIRPMFLLVAATAEP